MSAVVSQSQAAPAPDYASELPAAVEVCSCEEALALRAEVARLTEALAAAERDNGDYEQRWLKAERDCGAAEARCRVLQANWDACHGQHRTAEERVRAIENLLDDTEVLRENFGKAEAELATLRDRVNGCPRCGGVTTRG